MLLASIVVLYTLTTLTITHADRGRPTLKDDERDGLVHDLNEFTMNAKLFMYDKSIYMNAKSIYMNAKRTKLNLKTTLYENFCFLRKLSKLAK